MSLSIGVLLVILAFIAFVLAAIGWSWRKLDLIAIGLALLTASIVLPLLSRFGLKTLVLVLALIAFVAAAAGWRYRKVNLIAVGLGLFTLSYIVD